MAVLNGYIAGSPDFPPLNNNISSDLGGYDNYTYEVFTSDSLIAVIGPKTKVIAAGLGNTKSGYIGGSYFLDYYFRFHLIPTAIDLGALLSNQVRVFHVWNAWLDQQSYSSIAAVNDDGMVLTEPVTPPHTYEPLEIQEYSLNVSDEGPGSINATFTFILGGDAYELRVTGTRIIVFPFPPNWRDNIVEGLSFKTVVLPAESGDEQRYTLTQKARRSFEYSAPLLNEFDASLFETFLYGWQARQFAVPVWADYGTLDTAGNINDLTLDVDPSLKSYFDGGLAILYGGVENYETVEIETVNAGDLTLANGLLNNWPVGTKVYPINIARMPTNVAWRRHTNDKSEAALRFMCDPVLTEPYLPVITAPNSYNGFELYLEKPDWSSPIAHDSEGDFIVDDPGYGAVYVKEQSEFQPVTRRFRWVLDGRQAIHDFRGFLLRRFGRLKPCYLPTWHNDLTLSLTIGPADTAITVRDNLFARLIGEHPARQHLYIRDNDGNAYPRGISNPVTNGDGTQSFTISSVLGATLTEADILMMCYLGLYRLKSDSINFTWYSDAVAVVEADFVLVTA